MQGPYQDGFSDSSTPRNTLTGLCTSPNPHISRLWCPEIKKLLNLYPVKLGCNDDYFK
jgi:hypothetical protein